MIAVDANKRRGLSDLFQGYKWNYLPDAILDGYMGEAYVDDADNPQMAVLEAPKLKLSILGGDARRPAARKYLEELSVPRIVMFGAEGWDELLREIHGGRLIQLPRYAFSSEKLDRARLYELRSRLPEGYRLERMDIDLAQKLAGEGSEFAADHMVNFDSPEDFIARGFGFCVLEGDDVASVATTFVICDRGIEIQINTRKNHRRRGLATVVAAQLLIYSLENGLDPHWDAANEASVGLAKKLGYTSSGTYPMYIVVRSRSKAVYGRVFLKVQGLLRR
jgi:hypothetical protein